MMIYSSYFLYNNFPVYVIYLILNIFEVIFVQNPICSYETLNKYEFCNILMTKKEDIQDNFFM